MSTNTNANITSYGRRSLLAGLGALALVAVASDASAGPLTDAEIAAFTAGPAKHVVNSPLNARIPQGATSPGFRLTMVRKTDGPLGNRIDVRTAGEIYIPSFTHRAIEGSRGNWSLVTRTYPGGFVSVNTSDTMSSGASTIVHRSVSIPGAASVDITLTFNAASTPKTVLVTLNAKNPDYGFWGDQARGINPPRPIKYDDKPLGGAFVYAIQAPPAGGGGA